MAWRLGRLIDCFKLYNANALVSSAIVEAEVWSQPGLGLDQTTHLAVSIWGLEPWRKSPYMYFSTKMNLAGSAVISQICNGSLSRGS